MLAGQYFQQTGDLDFIRDLWPHVERALSWIDVYGDRDGDGFVEYERQGPKGLVQQGWKDSHDSVFHADGSLAAPPIALCEVQGYVYAAKKEAASLARALGDTKGAGLLDSQANALQESFEKAFWCEELSTYALALDRDKRPCRVRTSNAGHCLYSGIAHPERAKRVAHILMGEDCFSGWGVRTVSALEANYNPISYHNGSVWPHDNALLAAGLAQYGLTSLAARLTEAIFEVSSFFEGSRLPELLCGLHRRTGEGPTRYPVACSPQAWSAAAPFMLLKASLGLSFHARKRLLLLDHPCLPESISFLVIRALQLNDSAVDLRIERGAQGIQVDVLTKSGTVDVTVRQ
jgi:glycogen debranching enzyme